ncbi:phospholipase A2 group XV-like [Anthonomus grandis grandis]|uniref:phospholipase A2 group XV-like n=1 Tax=Anthonomus grandis grandis TaxID=2921223 RepID=UPI0021655EDC|nr:phospholipase A2 group XV-like [Anthonomus grandis grandis]
MNIKSIQLSWVFLSFLVLVNSSLHPVVFIPGDGGNQLEAKLNKSDVIHYICAKTSDYFNIWLNMELLVPIVIDCWIDNIKLIYDNVTRTTHNPPGVDIRVPGFGNSETVEWIDPSHAATGSYFNNIADILVSMGYTRNVNIRGAPYDFRKGPNENQDYFVRLKKLIEETYEQNNQTSVMLIVHSMGGPMSLYFLQKQSQAWKDKYIKRLIALSGAWGGSVKAVKVYAIGDDLGSYVLRPSTMRAEQISQPSTAWLLPSPLFWKPNEVLVQTDKKNFTLSNLNEFFNAISFPEGWEMKKDLDPYKVQFEPPGVEIHCLYGTGVDTVERLYYKPGTWLDGSPTLITGDGDGTVNLRSLQGCHHWQTLQKQKVFYQPLPKTDHLEILRSNLTMEYVAGLVKADEPALKNFQIPTPKHRTSSFLRKLWNLRRKNKNEVLPIWPPEVLYINDV